MTISHASGSAPDVRSGMGARVHPGLGRLGLLLVSVTSVLDALLALLLGDRVGTLVHRAGTTQVSVSQLRSMQPGAYHRVVWMSLAWMAVALTGLVGWAVCWVALNRGSGRRLAGAGLVLGVLGLAASGVTLVVGMLTHLPR